MSRNAAVVVAALLVAAGCSSGHAHASAPAPAPTSTTTVSVHPIAWTALHNPLLASSAYAWKDPALVATPNGWVALFSQVDAAGTWRIGIARSADLAHWSRPTTLPHDPAIEGEASPDVVRAPDGSYVVTYQSSTHDRAGGQSKLYARTTRDFVTFSPPTRLAANLHTAPGDRLIDAALVYSPAGLLLGYKLGTTDAGSVQHFEIARSATGSLAGPWELLGRPAITVYGDTIENYQFVALDGRWHLLATSNMFDRPELFALTGNAREPAAWLHWSAPRELQVPQESWNPGRGLTGSTFEHANCAYLVDRRAEDGFVYLVYADAPDMTSFGRQGHAALAIARSRDLVHWSVPPNR